VAQPEPASAEVVEAAQPVAVAAPVQAAAVARPVPVIVVVEPVRLEPRQAAGPRLAPRLRPAVPARHDCTWRNEPCAPRVEMPPWSG